jgi:hypothetical protein
VKHPCFLSVSITRRLRESEVPFRCIEKAHKVLVTNDKPLADEKRLSPFLLIIVQNSDKLIPSSAVNLP